MFPKPMYQNHRTKLQQHKQWTIRNQQWIIQTRIQETRIQGTRIQGTRIQGTRIQVSRMLKPPLPQVSVPRPMVAPSAVPLRNHHIAAAHHVEVYQAIHDEPENRKHSMDGFAVAVVTCSTQTNHWLRRCHLFRVQSGGFHKMHRLQKFWLCCNELSQFYNHCFAEQDTNTSMFLYMVQSIPVVHSCLAFLLTAVTKFLK